MLICRDPIQPPFVRSKPLVTSMLIGLLEDSNAYLVTNLLAILSAKFLQSGQSNLS
jgi:hypothetical protein